MNKILAITSILVFTSFLSSCGHKELTTAELKQRYGKFEPGQSIKFRKIDYMKYPIAKRINKHPVEYEYLKKVDIYSIAYMSDGLFVTGLMVTPKKIGKFPCIVYNRGGNQEYGRLLVASGVDVMGPIAAKGYVVVASNYRGNSGSEGKEEFGGKDINDVLNLMTSLHELPMADATKIGMFGVSRGGMMTYLALKNSDQIKAAVTVGGISNLFNTIDYHEEIEEVCIELIPSYKIKKQNELMNRSAVFWADKMRNVPLLIFHGSEDKHVSPTESRELSDKLKQINHPHELVIYENDNHGIRKNRKKTFQKMIHLFDTHVKGNS